MKQICLDTKQMQKLESLGLDTSDASCTYHLAYNSKPDSELEETYDLIPFAYSECINNIGDKTVLIPAYTLSDILEKLPDSIEVNNERHFLFIQRDKCDIWNIEYANLDTTHNEFSDSLLDAAHQMLLWCIENNYIKTDKV